MPRKLKKISVVCKISVVPPFQICGLKRPFLALALLIFVANFPVNEATCRKEKMIWGSALVNHTYKTLNSSNFIACVLKCDEDPQCRSCNFWWNKLDCELNYAATYSAATSFIREVNCVHRDMDWEPEKWFVEIPDEVCMGAKDDTPGKFFTPMAGKISAIKLVYSSGKVGCTLLDSSKWGCDGDSSNLLTLITDDQNNVVFPENYHGQHHYTLPGFTSSSPELLFTFSFPLEVTAGLEYRVWYSEDLLSYIEFNNHGPTCMKVIVLFSI